MRLGIRKSNSGAWSPNCNHQGFLSTLHLPSSNPKRKKREAPSLYKCPVIDLDTRWRHFVPPIEEFNSLVAAHQEIDSTILPVGDGVTIAVKKRHIVTA
jgi:hypothetical protein